MCGRDVPKKLRVFWSISGLWLVVRGVTHQPIPEGRQTANGLWLYPATPRYARLLARVLGEVTELRTFALVPGGDRCCALRVGNYIWLASPPFVDDEVRMDDRCVWGVGASRAAGWSLPSDDEGLTVLRSIKRQWGIRAAKNVL